MNIEQMERIVEIKITIETSKGPININMFPEKVPVTTANFLNLAKKGFYDGLSFHRVIPNFMIQGGGYDAQYKERNTRAPVQHEGRQAFLAGLKNQTGYLAMARTNVFNSATSEFFINVVDNTFLDYKNAANPGYAVFGSVVQGMDVVDAIIAEPTAVKNGFADVPVSDVVISLALQTQ